MNLTITLLPEINFYEDFYEFLLRTYCDRTLNIRSTLVHYSFVPISSYACSSHLNNACIHNIATAHQIEEQTKYTSTCWCSYWAGRILIWLLQVTMIHTNISYVAMRCSSSTINKCISTEQTISIVQDQRIWLQYVIARCNDIERAPSIKWNRSIQTI